MVLNVQLRPHASIKTCVHLFGGRPRGPRRPSRADGRFSRARRACVSPRQPAKRCAGEWAGSRPAAFHRAAANAAPRQPASNRTECKPQWRIAPPLGKALHLQWSCELMGEVPTTGKHHKTYHRPCAMDGERAHPSVSTRRPCRSARPSSAAARGPSISNSTRVLLESRAWASPRS